MEEWLPLSQIIQADSAESSPSSEDTDAEESSDASGEEAVTFYDSDTIRVTSAEVELSDVIIPVVGIAKVSPQIETLHRFRPMLGCIILGVLIVCLVLLEIPKSTVTHWVVWGAVLLGLGLWWLRCFYAAMRAPRSLLVIDLTDGDEHIVRLSPQEVTRSSEAIKQALASAAAAAA